MWLIVTLNGDIINNLSNKIGAKTARCIHSSGAWTGSNLILDEGLDTRIGVNHPAIVREIPHVDVFPAFFREGPAFWALF